ncbi:MAG: DUF4384 domain-containing protein [Proteobacteria bacterium]|nr:DUF4384 domain-containing protein [Pseudomonadota bacterium]
MTQRLWNLIIAAFTISALILWFSGAALALEVRETGRAFQVDFAPAKDVFQVGERIEFKVRGSRDFHLYLFGIDAENDQGYVLLPNPLQNDTGYQAGREYTVPEARVEFYARNPGTEKIIMVASTRKLDVRTDGLTKLERFFAGRADEVEARAKSLRLDGLEPEKQTVFREIHLVVTGQDDRPEAAETKPPSEEDPTVFVSADRPAYRVGDPVRITFGADRQGFAYLILVEPDGGKVMLKKQEISGDRFYTVQGRASAPTGRQTLFAVFDPKGELDMDKLVLPAPSAEQVKGIILDDDRPRPFALYPLVIKE